MYDSVANLADLAVFNSLDTEHSLCTQMHAHRCSFGLFMLFGVTCFFARFLDLLLKLDEISVMKFIFGQPTFHSGNQLIYIFCHDVSLDSPEGRGFFWRFDPNVQVQFAWPISDRSHSLECPACGPAGLYRANHSAHRKKSRLPELPEVIIIFIRRNMVWCNMQQKSPVAFGNAN